MKRNTGAPKEKGQHFERSTQLKTLFNHHLAIWKKRHGGGLEELAVRCGVSASYLSHVGRYGRVPGNPIVLLLALNFELADPREFLRAAAADAGWPFENPSRIAPLSEGTQGFLSVKLDMDGFAEAIRSIVLNESKSRSILDLTKGKALRIGLNDYHQSVLGDRKAQERDAVNDFYVEICGMLAMTLRCSVEFVRVPYVRYREYLERGEIDFFGPKLVRPETPPGLMTSAFCRLGTSVLCRKRGAARLPELALPKTLADLQKRPYQIAVLKNSNSHLFCNVVLRKDDSDLVLCESLDEAVERTILSRINRPAHLAVLNGLTAVSQQRLHPKETQLAFATAETALEFSDNCFVVRPDWPDLLPVLNQSIDYLKRNGAIAEKIAAWFPEELGQVIQAPPM